VIDFIETLQAMVEETYIVGFQFIDERQVMLLLSTLPSFWRAFITTQGAITIH
jgi:hypothetical protein